MNEPQNVTATVVATLIGYALSALLTLAIVRLPREKNMLGWPRCIGCGKALAWWQPLPIIGWLAQGGRARCCGAALSPVLLVSEVACIAMAALLGWRYGLDTRFAYLLFASAVLIVTGAIDWVHRSIYTFVIIGGAVVALAAAPLVTGHSFQNAILGALASGFLFALLFILAKVLFPSTAVPFGLGDVYLGIFLGATFGLIRLGPALVYGVFAAGAYSAVLLIARRFGHSSAQFIAYGSFLCAGALFALVVRGF